ncbi:MAG: ribonuclease Z [Gemmatimonadota bacterium]|nr:ribonuclease Z [Gemmatimonadota bacterium]
MTEAGGRPPAPVPEPAAPGDRFVVVGCGTVVPEADRACSAYWLESGPVRALLDCGPGALQAMARLGLPWSRITDLVLTHFHADHVGAMPGLLFALTHALLPETREEPLRIHGPRGTRDLVDRMAAAFGPFVTDPGFPVEICEMRPGADTVLGGAVTLRGQPVPHTAESQALRLAGGPGTIVYTGDTGPCPELASFARGADLLVCECALPDSHAVDNHLSPASVAAVAAGAAPGLLLLTHVYPAFRTAADLPSLLAAAGWRGRTEVAREGWRFPT